jgi:DNA-binding MarR family transcriptional regulator
MLKELNPLLHSQLRLAIMSILMNCEEASFVYIKEQTQATAGNLSVQLDKLVSAGYITVEKKFQGKKPLTLCSVTDAGKKAFEEYVNALRDYLKVE